MFTAEGPAAKSVVSIVLLEGDDGGKEGTGLDTRTTSMVVVPLIDGK